MRFEKFHDRKHGVCGLKNYAYLVLTENMLPILNNSFWLLDKKMKNVDVGKKLFVKKKEKMG